MRHRKILQKGGDKPYNVNANILNRFTDSEMEKHMNPIYGSILCGNGYISNLYYLKKSEVTDSLGNKLIDSFIEYFTEGISKNKEEQQRLINKMLEDVNIINKTCTKDYLSKTIKPTKDIMDVDSNIILSDLGRYIAVKYVNKLSRKEKNEIVVYLKDRYSVNQKYKEITPQEKEIIIKCVTRFNKFINIDKDDIFAFHMILFCMWWKASNDEGIDKYYEGIQEIFDIVNKCFPENPPLIISSLSASASASASARESFEKLVLDITTPEFHLYETEYSLLMCPGLNSKYPDCGETLVRNIINILCYNGKNFNIDLLTEKGAIPELIEYYRVFNNFELQSKIEKTRIFNMELTARDAWSKLIFEKSQNNIDFKRKCNKDEKDSHGYDMLVGLTKDGTKTNVLQVIENLMQRVKNWEDLKNKNIIDIDVNLTVIGWGNVFITNRFGLVFNVEMYNSNYIVTLPKKIKNIDYNYLPQYQKNILDILLKKEITKKNYIQINFSSDKLIELKNSEIKLGIFILSLTDKYNSFTRLQMTIDPKDELFDEFVSNYGYNSIINEYSFEFPGNFEFVNELLELKVLNLRNNYQTSIRTIDLSPLKQIEEIGSGFLNGFDQLTNITGLEHLKKLTKIGDAFLYNCKNITEFDLSSLSLVSIGNYFLNQCEKLQTIKFNPNPTIISVGTYFMFGCVQLKSIDLRCFQNIDTIKEHFLSRSGINNVQFPETFLNVTTIKPYFMSDTINLKKIDLSCFSRVTKIGNNFLSNSGIKQSDLSSLTELISVGKSAFDDEEFLGGKRPKRHTKKNKRKIKRKTRKYK